VYLASGDGEQYCAAAVSGPHEVVDQRLHVAVVPHVLREVLAAYPHQPCVEGREGEVVMRVHVSADGSVTDVDVVRSAGPDFDAAAVDALERFQFSPACLATGKPAPVRIIYKYSFRGPGGCS
jgi:TonB family protein